MRYMETKANEKDYNPDMNSDDRKTRMTFNHEKEIKKDQRIMGQRQNDQSACDSTPRHNYFGECD